MRDLGKWLDTIGFALATGVWWLVTGMFIGALNPESLGTYTDALLLVTALSIIYISLTGFKGRLREKHARRFVLEGGEIG